MKKTLNSIGLKVKGRILNSFEDEISPFGLPWKPLKESTKKSKLQNPKRRWQLKQA